MPGTTQLLRARPRGWQQVLLGRAGGRRGRRQCRMAVEHCSLRWEGSNHGRWMSPDVSHQPSAVLRCIPPLTYRPAADEQRQPACPTVIGFGLIQGSETRGVNPSPVNQLPFSHPLRDCFIANHALCFHRFNRRSRGSVLLGCFSGLLSAGDGSPAPIDSSAPPIRQEPNQHPRAEREVPIAPGGCGTEVTALLQPEHAAVGPHTYISPSPSVCRRLVGVRGHAHSPGSGSAPRPSPRRRNPLCRAAPQAAQPRAPGPPFPYPTGSAREEREEVCGRHGHTQLDQEKQLERWRLATWAGGKGRVT